MAGDVDPHPLRLSDKEDDMWAVQIPSGEKLLGARRFDQVVVSVSGDMARMCTIHPLDFVRIKSSLGERHDRNPLKAPKDKLQATLVDKLVRQYLPQYQ